MIDRPRILIALIAEEQEFQRLQADDARESATRNGMVPSVVFASNNAILQIQQLYHAIHQPADARPVAIVVETVVGEGLERVARAALNAGIGWILINRQVGYLSALRAEHPGKPIAAVGTDQLEIGRIQARQVRALVPSREGLIVCVQGPSDTSAARERLRGLQEGIAGTRFRLKVLDGNWSEASGRESIDRWLRLKTSAEDHPAIVVCQNDAMAHGASRALGACRHRPELAHVPLIGVDGLADGGRRLVDIRQLAATVISPSNTGVAVDLVARWIKTAQRPVEELLLRPVSYPSDVDLGRPAAARTAALAS